MGVCSQFVGSVLAMFGRKPDEYATVFASYSAGLAGVADGQKFAAPFDTHRNGVWQRVSSTVADMVGTQPVTTGYGMVRPNAIAVSMPASPVADVVAIDGLWAPYGLPNRASSSTSNRHMNMLYNAVRGEKLAAVNCTITPSRTDSNGGTYAFRFSVAPGATGDPRALRYMNIPAGRWTFYLRAKSVGGNTNPIQISYNGGTTRATLTPSDSWQAVSQTWHHTGGDYGLTIYPQNATNGCDVDIEALWCGPGDVSAAPAAAETIAPVGIAIRGTPAFSGTVWTTGQSTVLELLPPSSTLTQWSMLITGNLSRGSSVQTWLDTQGSSSSGDFGTSSTTSSGQTVHQFVWNNYNAGAALMKPLGIGATSLLVVYNGASLKFYVDGKFVASTPATNSNLNTTAGRVSLMGQLSGVGSASFLCSGSHYGVTVWDKAISDAEAAQAGVVAKQRAAAHFTPLTTLTRWLIAEGDSISAGSGDQSPGNGYASRAWELLTQQHGVAWENRAVISATLEGNGGNSLTGRQSNLVAKITELVSEGITPVVSVMIGANDSNRLNTQAGVDTYVTTYLAYIAALKAAGARVVVGTPLPASGAGVVAGYESGTINVVGGPLNGQSFDGGRRYYIELLRYHAASAGYYLADYHANATWNTLATAQAANYYTNPDYVHPNVAGHANLATLLNPVIVSALA